MSSCRRDRGSAGGRRDGGGSDVGQRCIRGFVALTRRYLVVPRVLSIASSSHPSGHASGWLYQVRVNE